MKKSLIALAVAGAFAAPAFAATENVDVYGKMHVSVSMFDETVESTPGVPGNAGLDGIPGNADDVPAIPAIHGANDVQFSSNASRIGFKGAEDLGGGLSAIWQVESGVNLDEGNGNWASRNSFLGVKGGFGTVLLGNHDTPLKLVGRAVDLFGDTMADSRNVLGGGSDIRAKNTLAYISPSFSGLTVAGAYTTDPAAQGSSAVAGTGDREDNGAYNVNATYANGPLFLGLGYGDGDFHENNGLGSHIRGAAGFTFGNAKIVGQYDMLEAEDGDDYSAWMVGGAFTMGNVVLKANYMAGEFEDSDAEPSQFTIGADYNLSKRTSVYALYAATEDGVVLGSGAGSSDTIVSGDNNGDNSVISLGMTHSF
jgi:predicted porin